MVISNVDAKIKNCFENYVGFFVETHGRATKNFKLVFFKKIKTKNYFCSDYLLQYDKCNYC